MKRILIVIFLGSICFVSCKKKEGCVDSRAYNYNQEAEIEDGSCLYQMQVQVWMNEVTAQAIKDDGISALNFQFGDNSGVVLDSANWPIGQESFGDGFVLDWKIPMWDLPNVFLFVNPIMDGAVQDELVYSRGYEIEEGATIHQEVFYP